MTIKTVQWNIGGGKRIAQGEDPTLLASYSQDGIQDIVQFLKEIRPDIVTLQEVHRDHMTNQAEYIAKELGLNYVVSDFYADSHIEDGFELGHAILSRFPITDHDFTAFINPKYKVVWEDGSIATSHDKGVTRIQTKINDIDVSVLTTHLIPFRRFNVDTSSEEAAKVFSDVQKKLKVGGTMLLQGDFNINSESLQSVLSDMFAAGVQEVWQIDPTTPKGHRYDHVLFRGMRNTSSSTVSSVQTDHYPIVSTFELL